MPNHFELLDIKVPVFVEDKQTLFPNTWDKLLAHDLSDSYFRVLTPWQIGRMLSVEFKDYIEGKGLQISHALMFRGNQSYTSAPIHLDLEIGGFNPVLNFVICDGQQRLRFYSSDRPLEEIAKPLVLPNGTTMNNFDEKDLSVLEENFDLGPFIMNTSIPHQAKLLSGLQRWCLTIRFAQHPPNWDKFKSLFKDDIIIKR